MIRKIETLEAFEGLADEWDAIARDGRHPRVFQTFAWCHAAWTTYLSKGGNTLYALVWEQEGSSDKVIFPLFLDATGALRFIMDEHSDFCDCVARAGRNHHLAFKETLETVRADPRVERIRLDKLDGDSEALNYFGTLARKRQIAPTNASSWIAVSGAGEFASSQPQLRSKDKANVRAIRRKAERFRLRTFSVSQGDAFPDADIDRLVDGMVRSGWRDAAFMHGPIRDFCRRIYDLGLAEVVELVDADGIPSALNFVLRMDGRRLSWVFLYVDPHASTELYVKHLYESEGGEPYVFDFGTGGYDYKLGTFRPVMRGVYSLTIPNGTSAWARMRLASAYRELRGFAAAILERMGLRK